MPQQMTWSGSNFDVVTGIIAPVFAVLTIVAGTSRPRVQAGLAIAFSVVGMTLLANVGRIAAASLPHGFTEFSKNAPLLLVYTLPFSYIVPVFVFSALFVHIALIRAIRNPQ